MTTQQKHMENSGLSGGSSSSASRLSFVLNPIASSPLDSEFPVVDAASSASGDLDLRHAASVALPLTPPDQASPTFPIARSSSRKHKDCEEADDDDDDEEEETDHRNCRCHDSQTDEGVGLVFPMGDLDLEQIENH